QARPGSRSGPARGPGRVARRAGGRPRGDRPGALRSLPRTMRCRRGGGRRAMSRFAYVLMTYRNPDQVLRLVRRLRRRSATGLVLVRHDARATAVAAEEVRETGAVLHEYHTPIDWGGWSMVAAQIRELHWLREHTDVTHVSFLSGQDYPI